MNRHSFAVFAGFSALFMLARPALADGGHTFQTEGRWEDDHPVTLEIEAKSRHEALGALSNRKSVV